MNVFDDSNQLHINLPFALADGGNINWDIDLETHSTEEVIGQKIDRYSQTNKSLENGNLDEKVFLIG